MILLFSNDFMPSISRRSGRGNSGNKHERQSVLRGASATAATRSAVTGILQETGEVPFFERDPARIAVGATQARCCGPRCSRQRCDGLGDDLHLGIGAASTWVDHEVLSRAVYDGDRRCVVTLHQEKGELMHPS